MAAATDAAFLAGITTVSALFTTASSGGSSDAVLADLGDLLLAVPTGTESKLFFITSSTVAKKLATLTDGSGAAAFPSVSPGGGGELVGVPLLVSDAAASNELLLIDASRIAAGVGTVILDASQETTVQLDDNPLDGATLSTSPLAVEPHGNQSRARLRFELIDDAAVAQLTGLFP